MRASKLILLASWVLCSCSHAYEQRQERFRERAQAGCRVLNEPPVQPAFAPARLDVGRKSEISSVIEASQTQLVRCYLESLAVWPQFDGSVVLNFAIKSDGTVGDTAVAMHHSTVFDPSVGCCLARVAQTWKFAAPPDGKPFDVEYPFELVKDSLKVSVSSSGSTKYPFTPQFPATLILAPMQSSSGSEIHRTW